MGAAMSIVVATSNRAKVAEIRTLLSSLPVEVITATDALGEGPNIVEDCDSFEGNALKKAREISAATLMVTLADDSGLEVDALGGRPGVRSARFASEGATDAENNAELLKQLGEFNDDMRSARFRCAIALVDPWDPEGEVVVDGSCKGSIAHQPTGTGGFGYDPLFVVADLERTMAELSDEEKHRVSHRAKALAKLEPKLQELVRRRLEETARIVSTPPPSSVSRESS